MGGAFQRNTMAKALKVGRKAITLVGGSSGKCPEGSRTLKEAEMEMGGQGVRNVSYASWGECLNKGVEPGKPRQSQRMGTHPGTEQGSRK